MITVKTDTVAALVDAVAGTLLERKDLTMRHPDTYDNLCLLQSVEVELTNKPEASEILESIAGVMAMYGVTAEL